MKRCSVERCDPCASCLNDMWILSIGFTKINDNSQNSIARCASQYHVNKMLANEIVSV